jgi:Flp pilus assembly pilin Flp
MRLSAVLNSLRSERGQAMVEYTLLIGLITVAAMGVLGGIGVQVNGALGLIEGLLSAIPGA